MVGRGLAKAFISTSRYLSRKKKQQPQYQHQGTDDDCSELSDLARNYGTASWIKGEYDNQEKEHGNQNSQLRIAREGRFLHYDEVDGLHSSEKNMRTHLVLGERKNADNEKG